MIIHSSSYAYQAAADENEELLEVSLGLHRADLLDDAEDVRGLPVHRSVECGSRRDGRP